MDIDEPTAEQADAIETDYNNFWRDIVEVDGELDREKVKRELVDYHHIMRMVSEVYDECTNGRISKPNTLPAFVIGAIRENFDEMAQEDLEQMKAVAQIRKEKLKEKDDVIRQYQARVGQLLESCTRYKDAYENMRQFAEENGLDTAAHYHPEDAP